MKQATKTTAKPATVKVRLLCIYSGTTSFDPGEIIELDAAEADRLVSLGAAEMVAE